MGLHQLRSIAVVHATFVPEPPLLIEDENMRRRLRTVGTRYLLRIPVVEIWISQVLVRDPDLHLGQAIAHIGRIQLIDPDCLGIVRLDRDDRNAFAPIIGGELLNTLLVHLGDWAVIASKDHHQHQSWTQGSPASGPCGRRLRAKSGAGEPRARVG